MTKPLRIPLGPQIYSQFLSCMTNFFLSQARRSAGRVVDLKLSIDWLSALCMREKTGTGLQVGFKFPVGGSIPVIFISMPWKDLLAISQSSRGLGLVACLQGQKINNMTNMASRKFSYIPKVICAAWNATIIIRHLLIYIYLVHYNLLPLQISTRPSPLIDWEMAN
jgi:hypothetical protein